MVEGGPVKLSINGEKIDSELIEQEISVMRSEYQATFPNQSPIEQEKQLREWARENVIEKILIRQAAMKDPEPIDNSILDKEYEKLLNESGGEEAFLKKTGLTQKDVPQVKTEIEQQFRVNRIIEQINSQIGKVSKKEADDFYTKNKEQFVIPEQVRAAHIVVHTDAQMSIEEAKTKMDQVKKDLKSGQPFEKLADALSDCPGNGGDLGYFARGQMVQEFEDVVFSMKPYEISDIFQTGYGFHIAKVYDRRQESLAGFEQVEDKIIEHLTKQKQESALENYLDKLREDADIQEI